MGHFFLYFRIRKLKKFSSIYKKNSNKTLTKISYKLTFFFSDLNNISENQIVLMKTKIRNHEVKRFEK